MTYYHTLQNESQVEWAIRAFPDLPRGPAGVRVGWTLNAWQSAAYINAGAPQ